MIKLFAILGAIAFILYSVSGPVLVGFGILALVLIVLWQAAKWWGLSLIVDMLDSEDQEESRESLDPNTEEDVSFFMGGPYNDDYYESDRYNNCVNAWQFLLADAEEAESCTDPNRREKLKTRAIYILSEAIKSKPDHQMQSDIVPDLLRLLAENLDAVWLLEDLTDSQEELDFDLSSELENSKSSTITDVLADNWEVKARSLMEEVRLSCSHSEEDIQQCIADFATQLSDPRAKLNILLTVYTSKALAVNAGWDWGHTFVKQEGLTKLEERWTAVREGGQWLSACEGVESTGGTVRTGILTSEWWDDRIFEMGVFNEDYVDYEPEFIFSDKSSFYGEDNKQVAVLFDDIFCVEPGTEWGLFTSREAGVEWAKSNGPDFIEVSFSVGSNVVAFFDEGIYAPYDAVEFLRDITERLNDRK